ncbi:hypothetical protein HNR53_001348 [Bacillus benzoevorans]|uniref:Uncharacterized protein n=1 Tax=Bacillus benzoevorans TaxID=1456 RepID=A0A7X0HPX8_9BACI|nr:hypothetical protein [Bacillus benzoevorans]
MVYLRGGVKFPTGGDEKQNLFVLSQPASLIYRQDLVRFQSRQYSLDGRRWRFGTFFGDMERLLSNPSNNTPSSMKLEVFLMEFFEGFKG